jgi:hypothetical protein
MFLKLFILIILKEAKKNIKELQDLLLKQYMTEVITPIVDSIEGNLYVGKFDFMDSSQPTSTFFLLKIRLLFYAFFFILNSFKL